MRTTFLLSLQIMALLGAGICASAQDYDPDRPFGVLNRDSHAEGGLKPLSAEDKAIRGGRRVKMPAFMDMSDRRLGMDALLSPDDPARLSKARHHVLGRTPGSEGGYGNSDDAQSWDGSRWGRPAEQSLLSLMGASFVRNLNNITPALYTDGKLRSISESVFDHGAGLLGTGAVDSAYGIVRLSQNNSRATLIIPGRVLAAQLKQIPNGDSPLSRVFSAARKGGTRGISNQGYGALNLLGFGTGLNFFDVSQTDLANAESVIVNVPEGSDVLFTMTDGNGGAQAVAFPVGGAANPLDFVSGGGGVGSNWQRMGLGGITGGVYGGFGNGQVSSFPTFAVTGLPGGGNNNSNGFGGGGTGIAGSSGNSFSIVPETSTMTLLCFGLLGVLPFLRRKKRD